MLAFIKGEALALLPFAVVTVALNVWMWPEAERLYARLQARLLAASAA